MAVREEYHFESADDVKTKVHAVKWTPDDGKIRAVLQICHGMLEYIDRYREFAEFMAGHGFAVVGHDHIGHGESVSSAEELGIMHSSDPAETMIRDMAHNYAVTREQYPDKPYFILGHSMGSYLLRRMLSEKASELKDLSGAVIMGTGTESDGTIRAGKMILNTIAAFRGWDHKSSFVSGLMYGKPYKKYNLDGTDPANSWLSKNVENVKAYYHDPLDTYSFSLNGYRVLLDCTAYDNRQENIDKVNKGLPILFASGQDDPVGNMGRGVEEAYRRFKKAGIRDVEMKLYPGDRHEILNETDREKVYEDLLTWFTARMESDPLT